MSQHEYTVPLAAKPDEMHRVALAFRAGEQKERDRILNHLKRLPKNVAKDDNLGVLVWTNKLIKDLGIEDSVI